MKKIAVFITTFLLVTIPMAIANANPSGGWGLNGPQTVLGSDEFLGCHFLYNGEFASLNSALGNVKSGAENTNFFAAENEFYDAYYRQGGVLQTDGYLYAYAYALQGEAANGQSLNSTYEANANNLCSPITTVTGNASNYTNIDNSYTVPGSPNNQNYYRSGCGPTLILDGDSWMEANFNLGFAATLLSAEFGYNVQYSPGTGSGASLYIDTSANPPNGGEGYTLDTFDGYGTITHSHSTVKTGLGANEFPVVIHELMLGMGAGEPELNGTIELMQTQDSSTLYPQLGDWNSGVVNGIGYTPCNP